MDGVILPNANFGLHQPTRSRALGPGRVLRMKTSRYSRYQSVMGYSRADSFDLHDEFSQQDPELGVVRSAARFTAGKTGTGLTVP